MSNPNTPFGLKAVRHATGGQIMHNDYPVAVTYTTAIYQGDQVQMTPDSSIILAEAGNTDNLGVFNGCEYDDAAGAHHFSPYWPGTAGCTNIQAHVYDDPNIIFAIQSDATGVAAADVGQLYDVEVVAGNAKTGISATNLDVSAGGATTGKTFRVLHLVNDRSNVAVAYSVVEVLFMQHVMRDVVSAVGGI